MMQKINTNNPIFALDMTMYASWYQKDVAPNLTATQKELVAKSIFDLSLEQPIFNPGMEYPLDQFPLLKPYAHTTHFSGRQLYAVLTEIFGELHPENAKTLGKPYMDLGF